MKTWTARGVRTPAETQSANRLEPCPVFGHDLGSMHETKVDSLILGAGIVGLAAAVELQRAGRQCTVIDKGEPGFGCSYGNAGWVTPCFAMPLPQPGMLLKSIGWLLNPDSPLRIKPEFNPLLAKWMIYFLKAMNEKQLREAVHVLTDISKYSLTAYKDLATRSPAALDFRQNGLLMVSATQDGLKAADIEMQLMREQGVPGELLDQAQVLKLEPSLKPIVRGGVYFPTEASVEPLVAAQAMAEEFKRLGGTILSKTEVYNFEFSGRRISRVETTRGRFTAELVMIATGTWSRQMAKQLRVSIPILGGKGYSLIVDDFETKPKHPIMIVERKIAVTPRANSTRLAGTLELVDDDFSITPRRVRNIINGSHEYLHMSAEPKIQELWRGLRPCTPDGVPMIGFSRKYSNLVYNVGHQMLGLQSAPGAGRLACDLIYNRTPLTDPKPFAPRRFE